jgi:hypothetical protein
LGAAYEPWFNVATNRGASLNTQNIYQMGRVGIGNSNPSSPLVVQGVTGNGVLKLIAPSVAAGDNWWMGFGHGTTSTDANDRARIGVDILGGGSGRLFFTTGATGSQTRAMFIDENQRVGIGTNSPSNKLHVVGNALFTPRSSNDGLGGEPVSVEIYGKSPSGTATQVGGIKMGWYNATGGIEVLRGGGSYGVGLAFNVSPDISGGTTFEAMRIMLNGNVGIAKTAPTEKLDVTGNIRFSGVLLPNNIAGTAGQFLMSSGSSVSPVWTSLTAANTPNIYTTNGTLAGNRVVTQEANNLTFSSTSGNFIYNPSTSGRMGVGTSSPQAKLHINSELAATNTINADASVLRLSRPSTTNVNWDNIAQFNLGSYAAATPNAETRLDLGLNNLENADSTFTKVMTWQANGNVGIGTTAPDRTLSIVQAGNGTAFISNLSPNLMRFESTVNSSSIGHFFKAKNAAGTVKEIVTGINPNSNANNGVFFIGLGTGDDLLGFDLVNYNSYVSTLSGSKFGVGTKSPTSKLEVNGAATNNTSINTSNTTIDYSLSNLAATTNTASSITLSNIKNGGAYTLAFTSTAASGVVTFTASGFTFVYIGTVARTAGKKHIYNFVVIGTEVFVTMGTEN